MFEWFGQTHIGPTNFNMVLNRFIKFIHKVGRIINFGEWARSMSHTEMKFKH